jgi:hypothetical protein
MIRRVPIHIKALEIHKTKPPFTINSNNYTIYDIANYASWIWGVPCGKKTQKELYWIYLENGCS